MQTKYCVAGGFSAAVAGQNAYIELWNPATSGVDVFVRRIKIISAETAYIVKVKSHTAKQGSTAISIAPIALGGAASSVECYGNSSAAVSGTQRGSFIISVGAEYDFLLPDPIVINPGLSLILENTTVNLAITSIFIQFEEVKR